MRCSAKNRDAGQEWQAGSTLDRYCRDLASVQQRCRESPGAAEPSGGESGLGYQWGFLALLATNYTGSPLAGMSHGIAGAARALPLLLGLALAWLAAPVQAGLGGDRDSVTADTTRFHGQLVTTRLLNYERHDIALGPTGVVHEYLSSSGKVFAISWQAPLVPDLQQLYGTYFASYQAAVSAQSGPGAHRHVRVSAPDFVAEATGHPRAYQGRAYVPSLVPAGVNVADLP